MKKIYMSYYSIQGIAIHIPSFRIVNLLCCEGHFSNITFINAKIKCRRLYLLDIFYKDVFYKGHIRTSLGRTWDVSEGVLRTSVGHASWSYLLNNSETPSKNLHPKDVSRGPWRYVQDNIQGHLHQVALVRPQDVIFQRPEEVGRGPQVGDLALHTGSYGEVHSTPFGDVLRTSLRRNLAEWAYTIVFYILYDAFKFNSDNNKPIRHGRYLSEVTIVDNISEISRHRSTFKVNFDVSDPSICIFSYGFSSFFEFKLVENP